MQLNEWLENVNSREDLIKFINLLRKDFQTNKDEWENITIEDFLEAMVAWINDIEGYYSHTNQPVPKQPSWRIVADILYASSRYE